MRTPKEVRIQRDYYAATAEDYDRLHILSNEHAFALRFLIATLDYLQVSSVLDVGSGTGRVLQQIGAAHPKLRVMGVEPVAELREVACRKGIPRDQLVDGDALGLPFQSASFDLVCAFGVLHHIRTPKLAVAEMLRVSRKAVFISDANNFGQGNGMVRAAKQIIDLFGLWRVANFTKTRGKGYLVSEGDGLSYSYSVFNDLRQIRRACSSTHLVNTSDAGVNPYRTASHVALLGILKT